MTLLHDSTDSGSADSAPMRFRAATVEEALIEARGELGPDVEIVDANRIRRGGVGGFFATDLGVELAIRPADRPNRTVTTLADHLDERGAALGADGRDHGADDDRHRDDFADRLAALDRAIYGDGAATGLQRLLQRAAGSDDFARGDDTADATPGAGAHATFAQHLEQAAKSLPRRDRTATRLASSASRSEPDGTQIEFPVRAVDGTAESAARPAGSNESSARTAGRGDPEPLRPTADPGPAPTPQTAHAEPIDQPATRSEPTGRSIARSDGSHAGQHADIAADAVGRMISELTRATPAGGSRTNQLSRLTVSVTAADGSSIELEAELNGVHGG